MDALDELMAVLDAIGRALDTPDLEPDTERDDWDDVVTQLDDLRGKLSDDALPKLAAASKIADAELPGASQNLRNNLAHHVAELAAVYRAAGRRDTADALFAEALRAGPMDETLTELRAASHEPDAYVKLVHGRWHHRAGDFVGGDRVLGAHQKSAQDPALKRSFKKSLDGPRPITSAPALFRLNGFGAGLYGERDRRDDGSYVATYALSALYIPVIALSAYRVIDEGGGQYLFLAKERLSSFATGWNWSLLGFVILLVVGGSVNSYLDSPGRRASIALEDARQVEAAGDAERAAAAYQGVIDEHPYPTAVASEAATGLVRVLTQRVESPMTAARVDEAVRVVRRYQQMPSEARRGSATSLLTAALSEWADEIGRADDASRRASLRLAELGVEIAEITDRAAMNERAATLHVAIAVGLHADWPLEALHHYVRAATPDALSWATAIVGELTTSLLPDAERNVRLWETLSDADPSVRAHLEMLRAQRAEWQGDERRVQALDSGDRESLALLHEERPEDQEVGASLADAKRGMGDIEAAVALLEGYGTPGWLSSRAQRTLASCYADAGRLEEADGLLTRIVDVRLPAFAEAQRAYDSAADGRVDALVLRAQAGRERELNRRVEGLGREETQRVFDAWLREQIEADGTLTALRNAYTAESVVVPTVLTLGTIKLRRAHEASGEARERLLTEAERLFLAIRQEAEGVPAYHLSLGQVYYRLGRADEGEAELRGVQEAGDLAMAVEVANVYWELGLTARAREVATDAYERASGEDIRGTAASLMSMMAFTLEDREMWLLRAPPNAPGIQTRLLEVRAERALDSGNLREADRLFAQVAARYLEGDATDSATFNNAALADMRRYQCDGDPAHLARAGTRMDRAMGLAPDSAVLVGNLADLESYRGRVQVLDAHIRTRTLRPSAEQTRMLIGLMLDGPLGEEVRLALGSDARTRHARELTQQEQVLAPQQARGWLREWAWASGARDEGALRAFLARLSTVQNPDRTASTEARDREQTEEDVTRLRGQHDAAVAGALALVESARRARRAPTTAAALQLYAKARMARAWETTEVDDGRASIEATREAIALWDGLGQGGLPGALTAQATLELVSEHASLREVFEAHRIGDRAVFILEAGARRSPNVLTAIQTNAVLDEACALLVSLPAEQLGLPDLLLGQLAAHPALQEAARPARTRAQSRLDLEIRERIFPDDAELASRRALLDG